MALFDIEMKSFLFREHLTLCGSCKEYLQLEPFLRKAHQGFYWAQSDLDRGQGGGPFQITLQWTYPHKNYLKKIVT